ncbi:hypothetical protein Tco_0658446 [Tanacetum coccineum]
MEAHGCIRETYLPQRCCLGAVLPEVAWSPALKANYGIGICPLGSWVVVVTVVVVIVVAVVVVIVIAVVVVICSCRPAPTVLGPVPSSCSLVHVVYKTIWVEVTLGTSRFSPFIRFLVTVPGSISLPVFCLLFGCWFLVIRGASSNFLLFSVCLSAKVLILLSINSVAISIAPAMVLWLRCTTH